jgi:hypothetical protein
MKWMVDDGVTGLRPYTILEKQAACNMAYCSTAPFVEKGKARSLISNT